MKGRRYRVNNPINPHHGQLGTAITRVDAAGCVVLRLDGGQQRTFGEHTLVPVEDAPTQGGGR